MFSRCGYDYDHDAPEAFSGQNYFPDALWQANVLTTLRTPASTRDQETLSIGKMRKGGAGDGGRAREWPFDLCS